nr:hypothetical protein [Actinomycetota bacterium]
MAPRDGPLCPTPVNLSALADRSGQVRWDRLAPLAASRDVVIGELLDEELLLCRSFAGLGAEAHPHWTPCHWGLDPGLRAVSVRTVERLDIAHQLIGYP